MPAQITEVRTQLKTVVTAVFAPEIASGWTVQDDKLHRSVGHEGVGRIGLSPVNSAPWPRDYHVEAVEVLVQVYGPYELKVDPEQAVDPAIVEDWAERLKRGLRTGESPTQRSWGWNVLRTEYPDDPTGNKTRFELYVEGWGNNPVLVETTG